MLDFDTDLDLASLTLNAGGHEIPFPSTFADGDFALIPIPRADAAMRAMDTASSRSDLRER